MVGIPFQAGPDSRRGIGNRKPGARQKTARSLARAQRDETIRRLAQLRDQTSDSPLALRACELLLRYSDGEPGGHNIPAEPEEAEGDDMDGSIEPPKLGAGVGRRVLTDERREQVESEIRSNNRAGAADEPYEERLDAFMGMR